jgi:hypothetical protein
VFPSSSVAVEAGQFKDKWVVLSLSRAAADFGEIVGYCTVLLCDLAPLRELVVESHAKAPSRKE